MTLKWRKLHFQVLIFFSFWKGGAPPPPAPSPPCPFSFQTWGLENFPKKKKKDQNSSETILNSSK